MSSQGLFCRHKLMTNLQSSVIKGLVLLYEVILLIIVESLMKILVNLAQ